MRLLIVGGGGFRVPLVYRALSIGPQAGLIDSVVLYDTDASRLTAIRAVLDAMPFPGPPITLADSLAAALPDVDVVFAATRVGGTEGRVLDERVALKHGLLGQETTGAGGISYALRSIPYMLSLARSLRDLAPQAWLINFTNPAGMVTQALSPVLGHRVIGICDSPIGLIRRSALASGFPLQSGNLSGVDYLGLNHLGWLRGLKHDHVDHLPALLAAPERLASFEEGRLFGAEFLRSLGSLPNEYLFYYYRRTEAIRAIQASAQTRGESIAAAQQQLYPELTGPEAFDRWEAARRAREEGYLAESRVGSTDAGPVAGLEAGSEAATGIGSTANSNSAATGQRDEADLLGGGYEEVALSAMAALLTGKRTELILNLSNAGTITALPNDAVIEVPSSIDATGARPLPVHSQPNLHQLGLMAQLKAVETAVVRAVVEGDRSQAELAFALHPLVGDEQLAATLLRDYEAAFPALGKLWR
ncbi:6-phospho-beta-glucosidase [Psychromicrobium lacuslunae]|uniref:6-phospho-beta-glucosidase n=1 Tax=Psychromicrobium lacuslunae TaxID=1618207 RepID=A0A0D4BYZ1_9MICC|nr:6-phospho-beta-glucosidase [Psychromicrobium lacuslunae]AJT41657.1 6-phospho-beta-glucosidase [Psychromicrobium lacuslunae]